GTAEKADIIEAYSWMNNTTITLSDVTVTLEGERMPTPTPTSVTVPTAAPTSTPTASPAPTANVTVTIPNVKAGQGKTVDVPITISNNPGIAGATLGITYNSDVLSLTDVTKGDAFSTLKLTRSASLTANPLRLVWDGTDDDTSEGTLATLTFSVNANATPGEYTIGIDSDYVLANAVGDRFGLITVPGNVAVYIPGDISGDGDVDIVDVIMLRRYLAGGYTISVVENALDVNKDGDIDIIDVITLRRYLAGGYGIELN
ncbi:MAG: hypothetical protein IJH94_05995, partial [Clostridia bacterium]|nr:hypothetical protein [Clostridia bacterium]